MTREDFNIEAIFKQYYKPSLKEQRKGLKNPKSIEMRCCKKKSLINNGGEVVCKFCGQVSHYEMVNEEFIDYYNSETQRLVQNVILKLKKINMVFVKPVMVKHP